MFDVAAVEQHVEVVGVAFVASMERATLELVWWCQQDRGAVSTPQHVVLVTSVSMPTVSV